MIAACPKCQAKYRVDAERLSPEGARLRCAKCQAVFRVRAPGAPMPAQPVMAAPQAPLAEAVPSPQALVLPQPQVAPPPAAPAPEEMPVDRERLVVVADPDVESGKLLINTLAAWGLQPVLVHDGVEALLTIQRMLPRAAILDAALPKMYGFQICEMVKRNESLRSMHLVLVGSVHHQDRYRRPPSELYGADVYLEKPQLLDELGPTLARFGYPVTSAVPAAVVVDERRSLEDRRSSESVRVADAAPQPMPQPAPQGPVAAPAAVPVSSPQPQPQPIAVTPQASSPAPALVQADDGLGDQRANAERLARIIVSDILLYHPEQFEAGLASGRLAEALDGAIAEGRGFFAQRVDASVRDERDFIMEELLRVARERGGQ